MYAATHVTAQEPASLVRIAKWIFTHAKTVRATTAGSARTEPMAIHFRATARALVIMARIAMIISTIAQPIPASTAARALIWSTTLHAPVRLDSMAIDANTILMIARRTRA